MDGKARILYRLASVLLVIGICAVVFGRHISWVSGWFGLVVSLLTVIFILNKKTFVACLLIVLICLIAFAPFFSEKVVVESKLGGDYDRFALMRGAIRYAAKFPLGVGPGNYRTYNTFYYGHEWGTTAYTSAHGTYSQHLAEMGIPGFVFFLAIPICGGFWLLRHYRRMQTGFPRTFVLASIGQLVAISASGSIGDYIIPTYHNGGLGNFSTSVYSWLIWGLAVAFVRTDLCHQKSANSGPGPMQAPELQKSAPSLATEEHP